MSRAQAIALLPRVFHGEADGAIPNGSRIIKCNTEEGDGSPEGSGGTVLSSILVPADMKAEFDVTHFYFVEWDHAPDLPVGVMDKKVKAA